MPILLIYEQNLSQHLKSKSIDIEISQLIFVLFISRQRLIQEYINSFKSFDDTLAKANEGIEFYKKVRDIQLV